MGKGYIQNGSTGVAGLDTATNIQTDPSRISTGPGAESDIYYTIALLLDVMSAAACYAHLAICRVARKIYSFSFLPRDAMHPRYYSHGPVSVSVCQSVSVTSRSSTKTAKHRITQTTPHDTPGTLVF